MFNFQNNKHQDLRGSHDKYGVVDQACCISGPCMIQTKPRRNQGLGSFISHSVGGYFTNMSVYQHLRLQISHRPTVPHREAHSVMGVEGSSDTVLSY